MLKIMGTKNESDILDTEIVLDTTMSKSSTIIASPHRTYIKLCYKHIWLTVTHPEKPNLTQDIISVVQCWHCILFWFNYYILLG